LIAALKEVAMLRAISVETKGERGLQPMHVFAHQGLTNFYGDAHFGMTAGKFDPARLIVTLGNSFTNTSAMTFTVPFFR
jgi:hypothetical protein